MKSGTRMTNPSPRMTRSRTARRCVPAVLLTAAILAAWMSRPAAALDRPQLRQPPQAPQSRPQAPQGQPRARPLGAPPSRERDQPRDARQGASKTAALAAQTVAPGRASDSGELAAEQMSVRELMHLETREALEQARGRARNHRYPDSAPAGVGPGREGLKLVAIYGVGKKLLAEVRVGSRPHVYLRGQALPLGAKAGAQVYRLHGITGSCVHLERRGEAHTLCLHPSQWAGG